MPKPSVKRAARGGAGAGVPLGAAGAVAGYWLPTALRARFTSSDASPHLSATEWDELLAGLRSAREKAPRGAEYWARLRSAMAVAARRLAAPADPYHQALSAISDNTGYSPGMVSATLGAPDWWDLEQMVPALRHQPSKVCGAKWQTLPGLPGRVRFFARKPLDQVAGWIPVAWEMPLYRVDVRPRCVLAYADANVPGNALTMIILALSTTLRGEAPLPRPLPPPVVIARNSASEPTFTPLMLSAIEEADPELVSMVATLVWDDDSDARQQRLQDESDLVLAAGADGTKVSFSVIGREMLQLQSGGSAGGWSPPGDTEILDIVALLAGLDSAFWDQNAGPSSRVHFVEGRGPEDHLPAEYARRLTIRLRQIAAVLPRGAWPTRRLHDAFDRYKAIEGSDRWGTGLQVISDYDDPFVVVFDQRTGAESHLNRSMFASLVGECRTRVIVVRPVGDIMDVAWRYLEMLPRRCLQSIGVAVGRPGELVTKQLLDFATACGRRGVTSIRVVGRGAFPPLAYSWDGALPLDLVGTRPPGYFTTVEFDAPFDEMMQTYRAHVSRLAKIPPTA